MIGLIIAVLIGACVYIFGVPSTFAQALVNGSHFLFWWYIVTTPLVGLLLIFPASLAVLGVGALQEFLRKQGFNGILPEPLSRSKKISLGIVLTFLWRHVFFIVGAYFFWQGAVPAAPVLWKVIIGGLFLLRALSGVKISFNFKRKDIGR